MPTPEPGPWRWFGLDGPVEAWATGRDAAQITALCEALLRMATTPLDVLPGDALPGAPSSQFRFIEDDPLRIVFPVTRPVVANGLKLITVSDLA